MRMESASRNTFPYQIHATFVNGHLAYQDGEFDESQKGQRMQFTRS